jgi:photosystem II stability/assembly factor-like uncharacterized protein
MRRTGPVVIACILQLLAIKIFAFSPPVGPPSTSVRALACESQLPSACIAIVTEGLYQTLDSGKRWNMVNDVPYPIHQIASHRLSRRLYAASYSELIVSLDDGVSFKPLLNTWPANLLTFSISSSDPKRIYVGADRFIFFSKDEGQSWKKLKLPRRYEFVTQIAEAPFDYKRLYVNAYALDTYYGEDYIPYLLTARIGGSWSKVAEPACEIRFFADDSISNRLFAFQCDGPLQQVTPSGLQQFAHITNIGQITSGAGKELLLWRVGESSAGYDNRSIWNSTDGGKHWTRLRGDSVYLKNTIAALAITDNSHLLLGTYDGGVYNCDTAVACQASNSGFSNFNGSGLILRTSQALITDKRYIYRSTDETKRWEDLTISEKFGDSLQNIKVHPMDSNTAVVYPAAERAVLDSFFLTHDGGKTWKKQKTTFDTPGHLFFDPKKSTNIYMLATDLERECGSAIYKSTDDGTTFHRLKQPSYGNDCVNDLIVDKGLPDTFYLSGDAYIYGVVFKTTDDGKSYNRIALRRRMILQNWIPLPQVNAYLASDEYGFIYRTADGARTWQKVSRVIAADDPLGGYARLYPADEMGLHYYAIRAGRIFESHNAAKDWQEVTPRWFLLNSVYFYSMTNPKVSPIYLGTNAGVYLFSPGEIRTIPVPRN